MSERRLSQVLTRRFSRVAWTALIGYAVVVVLLFAVAAEMALRRSLEHSADFIQSLLGAYRDSTSAPGGVMPSALADQLVGMGGQVVITRTTTNAGGMPQVYYLSPGMPARRLEGLPDASPEQARAALVAAITERARWRYRVLHRAMGEFDIYVVASRQSYFVPLGVLVIAAALLLPLAAFASARGARQAVAQTLQPLDRVTGETRAIGPSELGTRLTSPTGQAEVTDLADSINRMLERVDRAHRDGRTEAEIRDALAAMERGLDRTTKLVEELLLIARGENRQLALAHGPFDLGAVVDEVREITEAMATDKSLVVHAEPSPRTDVIGDADRTRHILLNLASNAVRYTPSGSVTFAIIPHGKEVSVSVQDTGPGIAPEHLNRIFDRFFRIDQSRSRELGGTGLGLAIARLLAELQGGRIEVDSAPGRGSTFTLWLPGVAGSRNADVVGVGEKW
ncbi:MAG: hypothetical protein DMF96_20550 [Acidobacteria bacterium]|nr:MAG: hypothetical protein DMF96_20550 [Acidobacteriota bacterium]